jgi:hypothetical protein
MRAAYHRDHRVRAVHRSDAPATVSSPRNGAQNLRERNRLREAAPGRCRVALSVHRHVSTMIELQTLGAARTVTGSKHLIRTSRATILLRQLILVHGEPPAPELLAQQLAGRGFPTVIVPEPSACLRLG